MLPFLMMRKKFRCGSARRLMSLVGSPFINSVSAHAPSLHLLQFPEVESRAGRGPGLCQVLQLVSGALRGQGGSRWTLQVQVGKRGRHIR